TKSKARLNTLSLFAFFCPPSPCRSLLAGPTSSRDQGREPKTAPVAPSRPSATVTVFAFARFSNALARAGCCLPISEASSKRQGDGQRFQKKAMTTTNFQIEAAAPASVRPSSVSKIRAFVAHRANPELVKPFQFPTTPYEYKVTPLRECPTP